jgi:ADP-ribose pyrophosphatase
MSDIVRPRESSEPLIIPNGKPIIQQKGKLGAIVSFPVLVDQGNGYVEKTFERFVRPPGTRIIACRGGKIYLQRERRMEATDGYDWRLPGGKVVDSFEEYAPFIGKTIPLETIIEAGKKELREEAHFEAANLSLFKKSSCGATVEWDLYYLVAEEPRQIDSGIHDEIEEITDSKWVTLQEAQQMCLEGSIDEGRTAAVLMQFIATKK